MARLNTETGNIYTHLDDIQRELAPLNVRLDRWPLPFDAALSPLLGRTSLEDGEKEQILTGLDGRFRELQRTAGYRSRDLIVLYPETPELEGLMERFRKCHTHDDDEVRYVIDGEGVFGFVRPDGSQVTLTVQAGEYIHVPAHTEHWFHLTASRRIKAVRYFSGSAGWTPRYTDSSIRIP